MTKNKEIEYKDKQVINKGINELKKRKKYETLLGDIYFLMHELSENSSYKKIFLQSIKIIKDMEDYAEKKSKDPIFFDSSIYIDILTYIQQKDIANLEVLKNKNYIKTS